MRKTIAHLLGALVLLLTSARASAAVEAAESPITAALIRFVDALEAGDARALEKTIVADTPAQEQIRTLFCDLAATQKALERSALAKFGQEGQRFHCGFNLIVGSLDRKLLASAKVLYDEPNRFARVEKSGELMPMDLRRNRQGQWQVVLELVAQDAEEADYQYPGALYPSAAMMRIAQLAEIHQKRYRAIIEAFKQTQTRIENGQLPTATAAQAELLDKLSDATSDAVKARAAVPSGRVKERS